MSRDWTISQFTTTRAPLVGLVLLELLDAANRGRIWPRCTYA